LFRKIPTQIYGCSAILKKPNGLFSLLGPRGTDKSWWTKKVLSDALRIDLLDAATLRELTARPERVSYWIAMNSKFFRKSPKHAITQLRLERENPAL
jgi:hypothetical protein